MVLVAVTPKLLGGHGDLLSLLFQEEEPGSDAEGASKGQADIHDAHHMLSEHANQQHSQRIG